MSARAIASFCTAAASFVAGVAMPVAFPAAPQWVGFLGLGLSLLLFALGVFFAFGERRQSSSVKDLPPPTDAPVAAHSAIIRSLVAPLSRAQQLATSYGARDFSGFTEARSEALILIAQIPHDRGTSQTVKDFLQVCAILMDVTASTSDQRECRTAAHRMSIGLFRFLHEGKPVERTQIDLPGWCRDQENCDD